MKSIRSCQCGIGEAVTPWCKMLQGSEQSELLHLWYKLDVLREEIEKRSSYLGKFRRTEEAKHLLDLISMTIDEEDLFLSFAKAAMSDVFEAFEMYAPKARKGYFWRDGSDTNTVVIDNESADVVYFKRGDYVLYDNELYIAVRDGSSEDLLCNIFPIEDYRDSIHYAISWDCDKSNISMIDPLETDVFEALVARIIYKWLCYSYPDEAQRYLYEYNELFGKIRHRCGLLWTNNVIHRIPRIL